MVSIHEFNMNSELVLLIAHSTKLAFRSSFYEYSEVGNFLNDSSVEFVYFVGKGATERRKGQYLV